ncbi:MAG TPA: flagellar basal body P-ring formation chaperone FlgA [Bacillota bacterium]|jgi:flagella basal body P-ring formation protein FlgA|nr:flagellar basal body P-ring formation chaperone FlgA [Bacillota bacterium]HOL08848.1 flagellar basal body P-ring formation chaperone FlgA [Bacillota bacterium]HPO96541.1 flagellar basal body P-ring formation chaperone FlgA [Bacillota bacterium]
MNSRLKVLAMLIAVGLLTATLPILASPALKIEIPEVVEIVSDKIYLGELGRVSGGTEQERERLKKVQLGAAPLPGIERRLSRSYIMSILRQYYFDIKVQPVLQMADQVIVRVASSKISAAEIRTKIEQLFPAVDPQYYLERKIELRNLPDEIWLRKADWDIKAEVIGSLPEIGTALFKVTIQSSTEPPKIINVSANIKVIAKVYQAKRLINLKSVLTEEDFEAVTLELKTGKEYIGQFPLQMRNKTVLLEKQILSRHQIEPVPLVWRGNEVNVRLVAENFEIKITGIADEDGWLDDRIVIINPVSKKTFKARVIGVNTVEVTLQ